MEYDVIIIGCGPGGLTAGAMLGKRGLNVLLVYEDSFGGEVARLEWVENYPEQGERMQGIALAPELAATAERTGIVFEQARVSEIESYSMCHAVTFADGRVCSARFVIVAAGRREQAIGIRGEDLFANRGLIHCAVCDAGLFTGQTVVVVGGGLAGALEALQLARHAEKVVLVEQADALSAPDYLIRSVRAEPRIDIRLRSKPVTILGTAKVEGVTISDLATGTASDIACEGVLIRAGYESAMRQIQSSLNLDGEGYIVTDPDMRTSISGIFAIGDARSGSKRSVAGAIADAGKALEIIEDSLARDAA